MSATPALLLAAGGVGLGHAVLPDHWVPLAVVGRTRRYPLSKVARLSGLAGVAHVLVSLALGAVIVIIGLQFRSRIEHAQNAIVGGLLIATGLGFAVLELTGHGHVHDHEHPHEHSHAAHEHPHPTALQHPPGHADQRHESRAAGLAAIMVPFGAAASPDLTILPVFLAATTAGVGVALASLVVFAAATIGTFVLLTLVATAGGYQIRGVWLERFSGVITATILILIGSLVLAGLL